MHFIRAGLINRNSHPDDKHYITGPYNLYTVSSPHWNTVFFSDLIQMSRLTFIRNSLTHEFCSKCVQRDIDLMAILVVL